MPKTVDLESLAEEILGNIQHGEALYDEDEYEGLMWQIEQLKDAARERYNENQKLV